jgi:hypothetical protein
MKIWGIFKKNDSRGRGMGLGGRNWDLLGLTGRGKNGESI